MSVRIKFDSEHNAEKPTFVLASRKGKLIGKIPISNLQFTDCFNAESVARFDVYKSNISSDSGLWEQIKDFKLVWVRDWNAWFELKVDTVDNGGLVKNVTATSLGESELSQINLYNYQINTETDIEREDYEPTVLMRQNLLLLCCTGSWRKRRIIRLLMLIQQSQVFRERFHLTTRAFMPRFRI